MSIGKLKDTELRNPKIPAGRTQTRLSDGGGLYLLVTTTGKYWRFDYRFAGKRLTLALGVYPDRSLKDARSDRDAARKQVADGIDPGMQKKATKQADADSFEAVAREWYEAQRSVWSASHAETVITRLENNIFPWLGNTPVADIEPADMLAVLRRIENRGAIEVAHRIKAVCGQIFRYAIATGRAKRDPVPDLRGALKPRKSVRMATITEPKRVGELLRAIQGYEGTFAVRCALQIAPYLFVRPGELRHAEWSEIDLEAAEWRIPAEKMKMKRPHIVPLSSQVVAILRDLMPLTGRGKYLFPSVRSAARPMSENTVNAGLRRMGFEKEEICGHGFRGMASTILHEQGWNSDIVERQLAHVEQNKIKGAYNQAEHLSERVKLMQSWADYLDALRAGADVIPIHRGAAQ